MNPDVSNRIARDFKGVWIPKEIWIDNNLSWIEKLFVTEINSLDNEKGCFASNSYFADFFNISKSRCSQIITSLKRKEYIKVDLIKDGKLTVKRVVRILNTPIKFSKGGYLESCVDNNTSVNNTNNKCAFEDFWNTYNKKRDKESAMRAWKRLSQKDMSEMLNALPNYLKQFEKDNTYQPHPSTFLNKKRWRDEMTKVTSAINTPSIYPDL